MTLNTNDLGSGWLLCAWVYIVFHLLGAVSLFLLFLSCMNFHGFRREWVLFIKKRKVQNIHYYCCTGLKVCFFVFSPDEMCIFKTHYGLVSSLLTLWLRNIFSTPSLKLYTFRVLKGRPWKSMKKGILIFNIMCGGRMKFAFLHYIYLQNVLINMSASSFVYSWHCCQ